MKLSEEFKSADQIDMTEEEKIFHRDWNKFWEGMDVLKAMAIESAPENTSANIRFRLGIFEGEIKYTSLVAGKPSPFVPVKSQEERPIGKGNIDIVYEIFNGADVEITESGNEVHIRPEKFLGDVWKIYTGRLNQYFDRELVKWNKVQGRNKSYWSVPR
jgi:hypothetical protein